jgi:hypothetical protein
MMGREESDGKQKKKGSGKIDERGSHYEDDPYGDGGKTLAQCPCPSHTQISFISLLLMMLCKALCLV